jgi:hypothetical protein
MTAGLIVGCGAPGEPVPNSAPVAAPITDLAAHQSGDGVQITFTIPGRSTTGERLLTTPAVEILRGNLKSDGAPDLKSLRVTDNIPGALAEKYFVGDKFQFTDPVSPEETKNHAVSTFYVVRTRLSQKRASSNSNPVVVKIVSVPERIGTMEVHVTEPAIELTWRAIDKTSAGQPLSSPPGYNVYRAELDESAVDAVKADSSLLDASGKLQILSSQPGQTFSDKNFEFGKNYVYVVRSTLTVDGATFESADSLPAFTSPRDIFPPAAPQSLSAAVLPSENKNASVVDLSWSINVEPDFAGYHVYRSDQPDQKGRLMTGDLLPTPAYRDTSVEPAHRYWYTVTAVDRSGNESVPSPPVESEIAQPLP